MNSPAVETSGNRIILDFETLEDALRLLAPWTSAKTRADVASRFNESLAAAGIAVELRVKGRRVAELGQGPMRGSLLSLIFNTASFSGVSSAAV